VYYMQAAAASCKVHASTFDRASPFVEAHSILPRLSAAAATPAAAGFSRQQQASAATTLQQ